MNAETRKILQRLDRPITLEEFAEEDEVDRQLREAIPDGTIVIPVCDQFYDGYSLEAKKVLLRTYKKEQQEQYQ